MTGTATGQPWRLDRGRRAGELGYQPGLDGIRAIAVAGVLVYHLDLGWLPGGFLGVDVFFVLSGFLITTLVLEELERSGRVGFRAFYLGRARRLLPALLLLLAVVGVLAATIARDAAYQFARDALASLAYVTNWWYIAQEVSYFEAIGRPPLLAHLWSLAIEEQFYLVWPAIAVLVARRWRRRGVAVVAIVLALASTAWMAALAVANGYPELADPSRAYFGTDAHAMGLLVGAALACAWRPGRISAGIPRGARAAVLGTGIGALAALLWTYAAVGEFSPGLYRGGFLAVALLVAVLIAAATHPASPLGPALGRQPLRWLGQRSYGIYLWHWPVFLLLRPGIDLPFDGLPAAAVQLAVTLAVAELSYRYVEMPVRRGAIGRWRTRLRALGPADAALARRRIALAGGAGAVALALLVASLATAPRPSLAEGLPADVAAALGVDEGGPTEVSIDADPAAPTTSPPAASAPAASASPARDPSRNGPMSVLGDSVVLGARDAITDAVPGTRVDASVARMPGAFVGRARKLAARDRLAPVVVVHPGTNGVLPESILRDILEPLRDYRVVLVNSRMPRSWRQANNAVIDAVAPEYPNVVVADWAARSAGQPGWFVSDGIHLSAEGARQFAALIKEKAGL